MPQNSIKNYFLVVLDYFSYKNGLNDLVRGLFSSLDIGIYIFFPPLGLCVPFWVLLRVPKCPKKAYKNYFLIVLDYFSYKDGPNDLVRSLF
jgi:hypothetical protein